MWGDGYLSVPGRAASLDNGRARAYCACSRCGLGLFVFVFFFLFFFLFFFCFFFLSPVIFLSLLPLSGMDGWMT